MKKLTLILLALLALTLAGCDKEAKTKEQRGEALTPYVETITYKGHDYIIISVSKYLNGITHDPDCPCREEGGAE